jgi:hypothetical protein
MDVAKSMQNGSVIYFALHECSKAAHVAARMQSIARRGGARRGGELRSPTTCAAFRAAMP